MSVFDCFERKNPKEQQKQKNVKRHPKDQLEFRVVEPQRSPSWRRNERRLLLLPHCWGRFRHRLFFCCLKERKEKKGKKSKKTSTHLIHHFQKGFQRETVLFLGLLL